MMGELTFEGGKKVLDITDFSLTPESTNNFFLYFMPGDFGDMYREKPHYERFKQKHPELHARLLNAFAELEESSVVGSASDEHTRTAIQENAARRSRIFEAHKPDLYSAYEAMYEDTHDNGLLFR